MNKQVIKKLVNKSDPIILEVGACDGSDTIEFLHTFSDPDFRIYCFEPDPRNIESFKKTISDERATLLEMGISDKNGVSNFNQSSTIFSSSLRKPTGHLIKWPQIKFKNNFNIDVITIDTFVNEYNIELIDFIWADIQGAEDLMLNGAINSFDKIRYIYTEYSDVPYYENEPTLREIVNILGKNWEIIEIYNDNASIRNVLIKNLKFV